MRLYFLFSLLILSVAVTAQQDCRYGKLYPRPVLSEAGKRNYEARLAEAELEYRKDTTNADALIWLGRRKAYMGEHAEAIELFSRGILLHPADARFYRHRGHRYITLRCFDKAIVDLKNAAQLVKNKADEVEPDGLPNPKNIPTSTLQSNIWYHLGLVYFIKGEYKKARKAYEECLKVSTNPDMYVATANWMNITLRRLNRKEEAAKLLTTISADMELIENKDYHELLLLYKEAPDPAERIKMYTTEKRDLSQASFGFGLGVFLLNRNRKEEARNIFQQIIQGNQWSAFGYIAAEAELKRDK